MPYQANVGSGSGRATTYHDLLTKITAFATSKNVDTVAVNAGGSGYTNGDVLTLSHASGYLSARFEATVVAGAVTALRILSSGAFARRAATAVVGSSGGSNYAVNDILQVDTGTSREKAKFKVATLSGSAVATVTLFETGGAYSADPSASSATTKVGPAAGTGSGCTLTVTMQAIVGTTGLSVTGGTGTGCTVNITLADTGWTVDGRNTNNSTFNSVTNEKEVVLKGDATGRTNKPYIGFSTGTSTSGINTRPFIALIGLIAHNPALALSAQPNVLGNAGTFSQGFSYLMCDENAAQEMDFWFTADDFRLGGMVNLNSGAANTDDGQYVHWYSGFGDTYATESENPYPMFVGATTSKRDEDPSVSSVYHSGLGECVAPTSFTSGHWFYRVETSTWVNVANSVNFATNTYASHCMFPMAKLLEPTASGAPTELQWVATNGPLVIYTGIGSTGRASATRRLMPVPGATPKHFPIPLTVVSRPANTVDQVLDTPRLQLRGFFWVYNTNSSAATIANFSEDYIVIGTDRYRIFHNHMSTATYQFLCVKEDV